jgi:hypothetical protein
MEINIYQNTMHIITSVRNIDLLGQDWFVHFATAEWIETCNQWLHDSTGLRVGLVQDLESKQGPLRTRVRLCASPNFIHVTVSDRSPGLTAHAICFAFRACNSEQIWCDGFARQASNISADSSFLPRIIIDDNPARSRKEEMLSDSHSMTSGFSHRLPALLLQSNPWKSEHSRWIVANGMPYDDNVSTTYHKPCGHYTQDLFPRQTILRRK